MTAMEVAIGSESKIFARRQAARLLALRSGAASETQYLNGGSETRRETAAGIIATYTGLGIGAVRIGAFAVKIGDCI